MNEHSTQGTPSGPTGKQYWRTLEERAGTEEFLELLRREFPHPLPDLPDSPSRREFLKLMGASLALAGFSGCFQQPEEKIVPYVKQPADIVPGKPLYFASTLLDHGYGQGILATSHMGRPTKIEGNPEHPASLGATTPQGQGELLSLYDPDRSQTITLHNPESTRRPAPPEEIATWTSFLGVLSTNLLKLATAGKSVRILTESLTSPTLVDQIQRIQEKYPVPGNADATIWHHYEADSRDNVRAGIKLAFGQEVEPVYDFGKAKYVVSLEADFFAEEPGRLAYSRQWATLRQPLQDGQAAAMSRLYVAESTPTLAGSKADHRLSVTPHEVTQLGLVLARRIGLETPRPTLELSPEQELWLRAVADDLGQHPGESLVLVGPQQPPELHAIAHALNVRLENVGPDKPVQYLAPVLPHPSLQRDSLRELVEAMNAGQVEVLLILGGNPAFAAPADAGFAEALKKVPVRIHHSLEANETTARCHWHIPSLHALETWGDAKAYDGSASLQQPLIAPLYEGKSAAQLLAAVLDEGDLSTQEIVQTHWRKDFDESAAGMNFDDWWQTALHNGVVPDTRHAAVSPKIQSNALTELKMPQPAKADLTVLFRVDPMVGDGRFANNGWLQELPRPFTHLTWDNAALISPATAKRLGLESREMVSLERGETKVTLPVWILPGQADDVITLHFGPGREKAGRVATGAGFNVYPLRTASELWSGTGITLTKAAGTFPLATTQPHHQMEDRNLVRSGSIAELKAHPEHPEFMRSEVHGPQGSFFRKDEHLQSDPQWGMAINLTACIGCQACTIACQSENNIPVVGREQVARGREMHWIRVDAYFAGDPEKQNDSDQPLEIYHQPVPCMHCENAPCEVVCPVAATVHSEDGLNEMIYNRCVGTRYCANNCPYKVRRFNFLQFSDLTTESFKLMRNPEVTVRNRGVMEKCTYCVQRIRNAGIDAGIEERDLRDGEVVTACQQVCPTQAITFGNIRDESSQVHAARSSPLNYGLLEMLNTLPRTTYQAAIRNPHPFFAAVSQKKAEGQHD